MFPKILVEDLRKSAGSKVGKMKRVNSCVCNRSFEHIACVESPQTKKSSSLLVYVAGAGSNSQLETKSELLTSATESHDSLE